MLPMNPEHNHKTNLRYSVFPSTNGTQKAGRINGMFVRQSSTEKLKKYHMTCQQLVCQHYRRPTMFEIKFTNVAVIIRPEVSQQNP